MTKTERILNDLFILARDQEAVSNARIAAALYYKGKLISFGFNQNRTSWVQRRFRKNEYACFVHAETDAVRNALKVTDNSTISKSTLFVSRAKMISGLWVYGNAKPCIGCQTCIDWFGIKKVFYTTDGGYDKLC